MRSREGMVVIPLGTILGLQESSVQGVPKEPPHPGQQWPNRQAAGETCPNPILDASQGSTHIPVSMRNVAGHISCWVGYCRHSLIHSRPINLLLGSAGPSGDTLDEYPPAPQTSVFPCPLLTQMLRCLIRETFESSLNNLCVHACEGPS